jgi:hypothetical protein
VVVDKDVGSLGAASDPDNYNNKKPGDVTCTSDTIAKAAHTTPGRASMILVGIGFDHAMQARPTKRSAAARRRRRISLARVLVRASNVAAPRQADQPSELSCHMYSFWRNTYAHSGTTCVVEYPIARASSASWAATSYICTTRTQHLKIEQVLSILQRWSPWSSSSLKSA